MQIYISNKSTSTFTEIKCLEGEFSNQTTEFWGRHQQVVLVELPKEPTHLPKDHCKCYLLSPLVLKCKWGWRLWRGVIWQIWSKLHKYLRYTTYSLIGNTWKSHPVWTRGQVAPARGAVASWQAGPMGSPQSTACPSCVAGDQQNSPTSDTFFSYLLLLEGT